MSLTRPATGLGAKSSPLERRSPGQTKEGDGSYLAWSSGNAVVCFGNPPAERPSPGLKNVIHVAAGPGRELPRRRMEPLGAGGGRELPFWAIAGGGEKLSRPSGIGMIRAETHATWKVT
ncbi:hypothetical protein GX51_05166 [Blastomyces parvus]|uniref:Uncharacterized protein n=1 Tax=Blastomyces parvus TaxID=2060905 RepID=A0A2B7WYJ8_9EURO|nr:hypothetical protein GX51_05166 [Blastomyces parvus]